MFIVLVRYVASLDVIDELLPAHVAFLDDGYARGVFVASGRQVPRLGGVILARAESKDELTAILAQDPFSTAGAATYEVIEWTPTKTSPDLASIHLS